MSKPQPLALIKLWSTSLLAEKLNRFYKCLLCPIYPPYAIFNFLVYSLGSIVSINYLSSLFCFYLGFGSYTIVLLKDIVEPCWVPNLYCLWLSFYFWFWFLYRDVLTEISLSLLFRAWSFSRLYVSRFLNIWPSCLILCYWISGDFFTD